MKEIQDKKKVFPFLKWKKEINRYLKNEKINKRRMLAH